MHEEGAHVRLEPCRAPPEAPAARPWRRGRALRGGYQHRPGHRAALEGPPPDLGWAIEIMWPPAGPGAYPSPGFRRERLDP